MTNKLLNKSFLNVIRYISIFCVLFLLLIEFYNQSISVKLLINNFYNFFMSLINFLAIILFIFLAIFPQKLEFLGIISFLYSFVCLVFDLDNPIGILMYCLGNIILHSRGFFIKKTKKILPI